MSDDVSMYRLMFTSPHYVKSGIHSITTQHNRRYFLLHGTVDDTVKQTIETS
jgi:hypothetical protein